MNRERLVYPIMAMLALFGTASYAADEHEHSQNSEPPTTQEFSRNGSARTTIEIGLKGSRTRKPARTFSGKPSFSIGSVSRAQQVGPGELEAPSTSARDRAVKTELEVQSARFASLEAFEGTSASGRIAQMDEARTHGPIVQDAVDDPRAQMISPVNGATLAPTQTFVWSTGTDVADYHLWVGSCFECNDLVDEDEGQNLSRTLVLPTDGRLIYTTLYSFTGGNWYWIDYQYQASTGRPFPAQMVSPTDGATLKSPQVFTWDGGYSVDGFYLRIGSCLGCSDILDENEGRSLSRAVYMPADGRIVHLRLYSSIQGTWWYYDYQYRAPLSQRTRQIRVNVTNRLGYPLNISINGRVIGSVPAHTTAGKVLNLSKLSLSFELIQPKLNGRVLGDAMSGVFSRIDNPSGTYHFTVGNQIGNTFFFLPLFTNRTPEPLAIEVNGGLDAENRCNCTAPADSTKVGAGYYRFFSNSNVRLFWADSNYTGRYIFFGVEADGNTSPGGPLTRFIAAGSGVIELIITSTP